MALILIRILLLLTPIIVIVTWLFLRARKNADGEHSPDTELTNVRTILTILLALIGLVSAILYFSDEDQGKPGQIYVPARVEDGKVVPGYFEDESSLGKKDVEQPSTPENEKSEPQSGGQD
ncbi:DUF6111 family protein [Kordiimonas sp. SCSIO 12610]|uniref:DUF6111 family protein n=1 Tax=Kordiimonas sp. SCSIO 12610 TaxID=2829597 RepID=UPI00210E453F|nr:DUF6111 family protein [Kordiimonas sp. SCSIO 12610]UTW54458.1 hypothetical protein KFF44_11650 [Kordiimonas sp. SCSIO 12610]